MSTIKLSSYPLEYQEGIYLMKWASFHPIAKNYLVHVANEGKRSWQQGRQKKQEGLKKGISDYFLAYPAGQYHGLWIELKRRKKSLSKITKEQQEWLSLMNSQNYIAKVCYGWEDAKETIEVYLKTQEVIR